MLRLTGTWSGARQLFRGACGALRRHPWRTACGAAVAVALGLGCYHGLAHLKAKEHLRAARAALDRWDFDQARSDLGVCLRTWPHDGYARALAAQAARRAGRFDEAEGHLRRCEELGYRSYATALESTLLRTQTGRLEETEETLRLCLERYDLDSPLILEALALSYLRIYEATKAKRCLDLLLVRQPHNRFALLWRGRMYALIQRFDLAQADYRKALELDPDYAEARLALADRLLTDNSFQEAAEHYQRVLARRPGDRKALLGLAYCRRQTGQTAEAVRLLDSLLALHPRDPDALAHRGQLALMTQRPEEAEHYLRRSLEVEAHNGDALYSLYQSLAQQGKTAQAKEVYRRHEQIKADQKRLYKVLQGLAKTPDDPGLYAEAGSICLRNGQESEALRWLQGALRKDERHARTHALLADYYRRKGNAELAERHRRLAGSEKAP